MNRINLSVSQLHQFIPRNSVCLCEGSLCSHLRFAMKWRFLKFGRLFVVSQSPLFGWMLISHNFISGCFLFEMFSREEYNLSCWLKCGTHEKLYQCLGIRINVGNYIWIIYWPRYNILLHSIGVRTTKQSYFDYSERLIHVFLK